MVSITPLVVQAFGKSFYPAVRRLQAVRPPPSGFLILSFYRRTWIWVQRIFGALPMVPPAEMDHIFTMNCQKALKAGMVFRSFEDTARDTLDWERGRSADEERQAGIASKKKKN